MGEIRIVEDGLRMSPEEFVPSPPNEIKLATPDRLLIAEYNRTFENGGAIKLFFAQEYGRWITLTAGNPHLLMESWMLGAALFTGLAMAGLMTLPLLASGLTKARPWLWAIRALVTGTLIYIAAPLIRDPEPSTPNLPEAGFWMTLASFALCLFGLWMIPNRAKEAEVESSHAGSGK
ncbi:MAG: hypothetical protein QM755_05435 [Luteolibacter sp.]